MPSNAETEARKRLANNGRNPDNHRAGIRVGSDLHLCEMLLAEMDEMREWLKRTGNERDYWKWLHDEKEKRHARASSAVITSTEQS